MDVESPAFGCSADWILTSTGWVGWIPVSTELTLELKLRVRLASLLAMLEYAYRLKGFHVLPGIVDSDSIRELYERLASIPAGRVLDRTRRSLYRSYISERVTHSHIYGGASMWRRHSRGRTAFDCRSRGQSDPGMDAPVRPL